MAFLGLSTFELIVTLVLLLFMGIGVLGLKIRREQLSKGDPRQKQKALEQKRINHRIEAEEDELTAIMYESGDSYDD